MPVNYGGSPDEIRNARMASNWFGMPVNNVPYSADSTQIYINAANSLFYAAKTAALAIGNSITVFGAWPSTQALNYILIEVSATTEVRLLNGAAIFLDFLAAANVPYYFSFMPQGIPLPNNATALTVLNVAGAVADFYVSAGGSQT